MAATKTKATAAKAAPAQPGVPVKYPVAKLRENCRKLFGASVSTYDGATYGMRGQYTVEEMKAHIKAWGSQKGVK